MTHEGSSSGEGGGNMSEFSFKRAMTVEDDPKNAEPIEGEYWVFYAGKEIGRVRKGPASPPCYNSWQFAANHRWNGASSRKEAAQRLLDFRMGL